MLSTWNLSPNTRQVPWGMLQPASFPEVLLTDAVTHVLIFLKVFITQETKEGEMTTPSKHEMLGSL